MLKKLIVCMVFLSCGLSYAHAGSEQQIYTPDSDTFMDLNLPRGLQDARAEGNQSDSILFLAAANEQSSMAMAGSEENAASEYEDRLFTGNKMHKYLGIGSVGAAILTLLAPKEEDGAHENFAILSALLGAGAVATGLGYHYEEIGIEGGLKDPDNQHALWAGLGALGIAYAAAEGPDSGHSGFGSLGGIAMMIGVRYAW